jgi:hypothetical protein
VQDEPKSIDDDIRVVCQSHQQFRSDFGRALCKKVEIVKTMIDDESERNRRRVFNTILLRKIGKRTTQKNKKIQ